MSNETPFETIAQRSIVLAKALLSAESRQYHDDIKEFPSEGELAQALMVAMPFFASIHVPETPDGFAGVMLMAEPIDRVSLVLRPCGPVGNAHGLSASLYKPGHMDGETALHLLGTVVENMAEIQQDEKQSADSDAPTIVRH
jgi:hypothetical protein